MPAEIEPETTKKDEKGSKTFEKNHFYYQKPKKKGQKKPFPLQKTKEKDRRSHFHYKKPIKKRQKKPPYLTSVLVTIHKSRYRKSIVYDLLGILLRGLEEFGKGLVLRLSVISLISPLGNLEAMENHHTKIGIEKENSVWSYGGHIQKGRFRFLAQRIGS